MLKELAIGKKFTQLGVIESELRYFKFISLNKIKINQMFEYVYIQDIQ